MRELGQGLGRVKGVGVGIAGCSQAIRRLVGLFNTCTFLIYLFFVSLSVCTLSQVKVEQ